MQFLEELQLVMGVGHPTPPLKHGWRPTEQQERLLEIVKVEALGEHSAP